MTTRALGLIYATVAVLFSVIGLLYCLTIAPAYTSDALLIPKEQNSGGASSGLATATRLLGIGSGADQGSNFSKFQKYWGSRDVAATILKRHPDLYIKFFRENWDAANNRWYAEPHNLRQYASVPFNALFGVYPNYAPTPDDLARIIKDIKLETDPLNSQIQIKFSAGNAAFAQHFLEMIISETDDAVRQAERRRDQDFVKFARDRLASETNVTYRDALTDSLRQFEISNMYAEAGENFSFQYVEAPQIPIIHSSPRPLLDFILSLIFGNMVAALLVGSALVWPNGHLSAFVSRVYGYVARSVHTERAPRAAL